VQARKDKRARLAKLKELAPEGLIPLGVEIPEVLYYPIRDPKKNPLLDETEALTLHPDLDEALLYAQQQRTTAYNLIINDFLDFPIDPLVLEEERRRLNRPSFVIPIEEEELEEGEVSDIESVVESVASYNSIAHNADFVRIR
jgi:hypothetical protein